MRILLIIYSLIIFNLSIFGQRPGYILADSVDLNSDGIVDDIRISIDSTAPTYTLRINDDVYKSDNSECLKCITGFKIVDIDTTDNYKEIEIEVGFTAANAVEIFSYDGKIIYTGHIVSQRYNNAGIVYSAGLRGNEKHKLNKETKQLDLIKQPYHYSGRKIVVSGQFPIFYNQDLTTKVDEIIENSRITIILRKEVSDVPSDDIFLIESEDNITGWISFKTLLKFTNLFNAG